jgi:hypothetical protein
MTRWFALALFCLGCNPTTMPAPCDAGAAEECVTGWDCPNPVPCESDDTCAYLGVEGYCDFEPPWTPDAGSRFVHPGVCVRD